jgi:hypothetical protein
MLTQEDNLLRFLDFLANHDADGKGEVWVLNSDIQSGTFMSPSEVNDIVALAEARGFVKVFRPMGTIMYRFYSAAITEDGRLWLRKQMDG